MSGSITVGQRGKLHGVFKAAGITDRDERLDYISRVVGRPVTTSNDLSRTEASLCIDVLTQGAAA